MSPFNHYMVRRPSKKPMVPRMAVVRCNECLDAIKSPAMSEEDKARHLAAVESSKHDKQGSLPV